jgi:hypothetical protein
VSNDIEFSPSARNLVAEKIAAVSVAAEVCSSTAVHIHSAVVSSCFFHADNIVSTACSFRTVSFHSERDCGGGKCDSETPGTLTFTSTAGRDIIVIVCLQTHHLICLWSGIFC